MSIFLCPKCNASLGEIGPTGILEEVCSRCHYKFQVLKGRLADRSSQQVIVSGETRSQRPLYRREYELRLELPDRFEVLSLSTSGTADQIPVREGNTVSFVYTMYGDRREDLLFVTDHTTGERFKLGSVGDSARHRAAGIALVLGIGTAIFTHIAGASVTFIVLASLFVMIASAIVLARTLAPVQRLPEETEAALATRQGLLEKKRQMLTQRDHIQLDLHDKSASISRLRELQAKMRSVGLQAYESRIATMDRAVATLGSQVALDERLLAAYARNIAMIEIEYETGDAAASTLASDLGEEMAAKFDELRLLEAEHAELSRELEANDEVEKLLRPG